MINRLIKILIELVNIPSDVIKSDLYTEMDNIINIPEDEVNYPLINYTLSKVVEETGGMVSAIVPITRFITTSFSTKSRLTKECIKDINNMTLTYQTTILSKIIDNRGNEIPELVSVVEFSRSKHYLLFGKNNRERLFVRRDNRSKEVVIKKY